MASGVRGGHLPAFAVLHVGVGAGPEQGLSDAGDASHHLRRVLLGAEGADEVQRCLHRALGGRVHFGRVADQERRRKLVTCGTVRAQTQSNTRLAVGPDHKSSLLTSPTVHIDHNPKSSDHTALVDS